MHVLHCQSRLNKEKRKMKWILLLIVFTQTGNAGAGLSQEFGSEKACIKAATIFLHRPPHEYNSLPNYRLARWECVPKG